MASLKSGIIIVGVSACSVTGYLLYLLFKKLNDESEEDYNSRIRKRSNFKSLELQIPREMVRFLIGPNGKSIKAIQAESNARINFKDEEDEKIRTCVIKGSTEACMFAQNLIQEFITKQPVIECSDMWIPQSFVGKVIGRCGEQILDISTKSGAKIDVLDGDRTEEVRRIILKGTRDQINIAKSLIEEVVQHCRLTQNQIEKKLAKREPRQMAKSSSPEIVVEYPQAERLSPIPGQPDTQFEVYVSAMVNPSHFWLQIVGSKATELDQLVEDMTEYYENLDIRETHILRSVESGDLVAALFQFDKKWYRAEVLNVISDDEKGLLAELYYVDYGDTDVLSCNDIYELHTQFLRLTFQAIECYLANVGPADGQKWTSEAIDKFEEWTHVAQWKKLSARMNGYCIRKKICAKREGSPVPGVDLFDVTDDHDVDLAEELVNQGYAVFKKNAELKPVLHQTNNSGNSSFTLDP